MSGKQFDGVAAHAKHAAREIAERALVLQRDEISDDLALVDLGADLQRECHRRIGLDRANAVDAGDRGDDDRVVALQQRARCRMAHAVDLLVDRGFLFYVGVGARDIGLGLVIIVVGDEILHRVVREEALELAIELRRESLVGRQDQRRALRRLDDLRHGEGLAGAGDAEQHLIALVRRDALDELPDRLGLVALGLEFRHHLEGAPALGLSRPHRTVRTPRRPVAQIGVAELQQLLERIDRRRRARHAARMQILVGDKALRRLRKARRLLHQRGIEQGGEMFAQRLNVRPGGFRARRARTGLLGGRHVANMGGNREQGKGREAL